ncbi:DinB family protein [Winogradskyella undariae]|uniref:DinB family protein n=1 Tax=Winogradskyella undariae TaxID=1285465 RepID=UPI0015C84DFA|nr:DinB family protein [Winogradskyella undariae]
MDWTFGITLKNRELLVRFINKHTLLELNKVPVGFTNNIIWNIAHVIVTQQRLVYHLSGLPMLVSDDVVAKYRNGTQPENDLSQSEIDVIKDLLISTIEKTKEDYIKGVFKTYHEYTVGMKSTLHNVEEAIEFNNFHEGMHLGYILALRKSL